jgi:hypothetical protein
MFCINNGPRVVLKDEHKPGTIPKIIEKVFEWNIVPNLRKFIDLIEGIINLLLVLINNNYLRFFERVEVVR